MPLMFSVFIPCFPRQASPRSHCNSSRLIAFIVLMRFRNRKLIDGASLSLVYFTSAPLFSPAHLSVRLCFICHGSTCRPSSQSLSLFISSFLPFSFSFFLPSFFMLTPPRFYSLNRCPECSLIILRLFLIVPSCDYRHPWF